LSCLAQKLGTHFLVRTCVDRLAEDGSTTVGAEMKESGLRGLQSLTVRNKQALERDVVPDGIRTGFDGRCRPGCAKLPGSLFVHVNEDESYDKQDE
jgi:hypothetical protein